MSASIGALGGSKTPTTFLSEATYHSDRIRDKVLLCCAAVSLGSAKIAVAQSVCNADRPCFYRSQNMIEMRQSSLFSSEHYFDEV